jgi:hypothetical protein
VKRAYAVGVLFLVVWGVALWGLFTWLHRRDRRRQELREQLREMEQAIWEESLPDWQREAMARGRHQRAAITREARGRLGLPEAEDG